MPLTSGNGTVRIQPVMKFLSPDCKHPCAAADARFAHANLPYEQMHAPIVGPANPYSKDGLPAGVRNHRAGHVEVVFLF